MFTFLFIFLLQLVVSPLHGFFFRVEELRAPTHLSGSIKKVILCYDAHENQYPIDEGREDEFNRFAGESVEWMISLATEFRYRGDGVILLEGRDLSGDNLGPRTVPHSFPAHQTIKYNRCLITLISLTQIIHLAPSQMDAIVACDTRPNFTGILCGMDRMLDKLVELTKPGDVATLLNTLLSMRCQIEKSAKRFVGSLERGMLNDLRRVIANKERFWQNQEVLDDLRVLAGGNRFEEVVNLVRKLLDHLKFEVEATEKKLMSIFAKVRSELLERIKAALCEITAKFNDQKLNLTSNRPNSKQLFDAQKTADLLNFIKHVTISRLRNVTKSLRSFLLNTNAERIIVEELCNVEEKIFRAHPTSMRMLLQIVDLGIFYCFCALTNRKTEAIVLPEEFNTILGEQLSGIAKAMTKEEAHIFDLDLLEKLCHFASTTKNKKIKTVVIATGGAHATFMKQLLTEKFDFRVVNRKEFPALYKSDFKTEILRWVYGNKNY